VTFKDLFSRQASAYARFRPSYPPELFAWVAAQAPGHELAVDVGAGNGQAAVALAAHFARVIGVDPSAKQIANAEAAANVAYRVGSAEATGVDAGSADLLTAAQALHWFDRDKFCAEVRRVVRPGGALAVWCYGITDITPEVNAAVHELYETLLGRYWEPERRLVETGYRDLVFPFPELAAPGFAIEVEWSLAELAGYLGTWSPIPKYVEAHGADPLEIVRPRLERAWGDADKRSVRWPLSVRAFRV